MVSTTPFMIDGSGVDAIDDTSDIRLYPNPFTDEIRISAPEKTESIRITDINGNSVMSVDIDDRKSISTEELPAGFYLVSVIRKDGKNTVFKMIKKI